MSTIVEAINDHKDKCEKDLPKKYVPWSWVVGLCVAMAAGIGSSTAYTVSTSKDTKNIAETAINKTVDLQEQNKEFAKKIENLEQMNKTVLAIYDIVRKMEDKK